MTKTKEQKDKQHNGQTNRGRRTSNKMAKEKDRRKNNTIAKRKGQKDNQHNGQKKKNRRTSNTMAKRKSTEGQATQ
jgi:hypothetical protein